MKTRKPEFPKTITVQGIPGISAKIYKQERIKPDKEGRNQTYVSYIVSYSLLGKRKMTAYSDYVVAVEAAESAIKQIANNEQESLRLTNGALLVYLRAQEVADTLGLPLDVIAQRHAECLAELRGCGTPLEACREHAKRNLSISSRVTVADAVKEMIEQEEKQKEGKRKSAWVKLLTSHVQNKFADHFRTQLVHTVEPAHINIWFDTLKVSERTKKNIRDTVKHFFKWARGRGYISRDSDPLADVADFRKRKRGKVEILTPDELRKLLMAANADMTPYLALRAFAGLRDSEASAIEWQHIDLAGGWIEITEAVAKASDDDNGTRRLIPVRDCLKAWLKGHAKTSGKVWPHDFTSKQIAALCETAKVTWKRNCLRHSYISYAIAESNDIPAVAMHSGNSPAIIRKHYLQVVKPDAAKAWFSVMP